MSDKNVDDELVKIFDVGLRLGSDKNISKCPVVPPSLNGLETPFTWKFDHKCSVRDIVDKIEEKLEELDDDDEELFPWKFFVLNLILCYEYSKNGDLESAEEKQAILDSILDEKCAHKCESSGPVMGLGLWHISLACKCFLLHASQLYDEVDNTLAKIVPFEDLKAKDKASILCMKGAYFSEFGYPGIKDSIEMFEEALKFDNECGEWYFLLGRSLSRLRRLEKRNAVPDRRELDALERAVEISSNVSFMVLLAQSYRETSRNVLNKKRNEIRSYKPYCDSLNKKSLDLYKKVLSRNKIHVNALIRCGLGLIKLPQPWKDLSNAKTCILKALEIAPQNPMANHVAGQYYTTVKDYKQAMEYLSKACTYGVFGAEIDLIVLKKKLLEEYDPVADCERLLDVYKEKPHQESVLCLLGAYYFLSQDNFKKGFTYWSRVIELDINSENLKVYYVALGAQRVININKIIVTEIMKLLNAGDFSESERIFYDQTITKYIRHHPGLIVTATNIDISLYSKNVFNHKLWKSRGTDKKYFSRNSGASHSESNAPSGDGVSASVSNSASTTASASTSDWKARGSRGGRSSRGRDVDGERGEYGGSKGQLLSANTSASTSDWKARGSRGGRSSRGRDMCEDRDEHGGSKGQLSSASTSTSTSNWKARGSRGGRSSRGRDVGGERGEHGGSKGQLLSADTSTSASTSDWKARGSRGGRSSRGRDVGEERREHGGSKGQLSWRTEEKPMSGSPKGNTATV